MNTFQLFCTNCAAFQDLPHNASIARITEQANTFFHDHRTRIGNAYCRKAHTILRTVA